MGRGEGDQTLDHVLEYTGNTNDLEGRFTPAQMRKTLSRETLRG